MESRTCPQCQTKFKAYPSTIKRGRGKYCSRGCKNLAERRSDNPNWKGGETKQRGYVLLYRPTHPFANKTGYVTRGRLNMESHLIKNDPESPFLTSFLGGKYLDPSTRVTHLDAVRDNDDISNLTIQWITLPKNTKQKTSI